MNSALTRASLLVGALLLCGCASQGPTFEDVPELDIGPGVPPPNLAAVGRPPLPAVSAKTIHHGSRDAKRVALTFDACSLNARSYYDERITKILLEMNVPATIFLGGKWMTDHPEVTRYLASLPQFELGNHSFMHPHMTKVSDRRVREEIEWTQDTLYELTGRQATLFRAPYGEIDPRVVQMAAETGLVTVQFDLPAGDADRRATKKKLVEYVATVTKPGSIVVMHINRNGRHTAEALPDIIAKLRKRGFEFVTVSELMGIKPPTPSVEAASDSPTGETNPPGTENDLAPHRVTNEAPAPDQPVPLAVPAPP